MAEEGELVGIKVEDFHAILAELGPDATYQRGLAGVALAAQKALVEWQLVGHGEWHDVLEAGENCYCIYKSDMNALCAKLGVK